MTNPHKKTTWITIPDETPVSVAQETFNGSSANKTLGSSEKVQNKVWWGAGFAALLVFLAMLFVPQQFSGLMKGNLFDGTFKVVPDFQDQQDAGIFVDKTDEGTVDSGESVQSPDQTVSNQSAGDQTIVPAESDAVPIQVEPIAESPLTDGNSPSSGQLNETAASNVVTNTTVDTQFPDLTSQSDSAVDVSTPGSQNQGVQDVGADLLQSLSKQIEDFKAKEEQSQKTIEELTILLQNQNAGIHGSAGVQNTQNTVPQFQAQTTPPLTTSANGMYRYNTHTVTLNPYDVLAKNKAVQSQQGSYQANLAYGSAQGYSSQNYNPKLAGVQGNAATGPAESLMFAFVVASFGMLIVGSFRAIRL